MYEGCMDGKRVLKSCCMNPVELSMLNPVQFTITVTMTQCCCALLALLSRMSGNTTHLSSILAAPPTLNSSDA
jgi:hypothetical protein